MIAQNLVEDAFRGEGQYFSPQHLSIDVKIEIDYCGGQVLDAGMKCERAVVRYRQDRVDHP